MSHETFNYYFRKSQLLSAQSLSSDNTSSLTDRVNIFQKRGYNVATCYGIYYTI